MKWLRRILNAPWRALQLAFLLGVFCVALTVFFVGFVFGDDK